MPKKEYVSDNSESESESSDISEDELDEVEKEEVDVGIVSSKQQRTFASFIGTSFGTGGVVTKGLMSSLVAMWSKNASEATPTSCQRETWDHLSLNATLNNHLLVQSATGSGKTVAFAIPVLAAAAKSSQTSSGAKRELCFPYAVIVAPTRELCLQISHCLEAVTKHPDFASEVAVKVVSAIGGVGFKR
jgi:superfamily II DNA/RNA helicase